MTPADPNPLRALAKSKIPRIDQPSSVSSKLLSTGDVAQRLGVSVGMVVKWIDAGQLLGMRLPGSRDRRVHPDSLKEFEEREGFSRARGHK
jgi:excisionase family DNA binding protein